MRYVFPCMVVSVEERTRVLRSHKDTDGTAVFEEEKIGYFVVLNRANLAIYLGTEQPALYPGDKIKLILESET